MTSAVVQPRFIGTLASWGKDGFEGVVVRAAALFVTTAGAVEDDGSPRAGVAAGAARDGSRRVVGDDVRRRADTGRRRVVPVQRSVLRGDRERGLRDHVVGCIEDLVRDEVVMPEV